MAVNAPDSARARPGVNRLTIASQIEGAGPGGFLMPPRRDNKRAFRAAMRHSRLVRITRVGLPVAIILAAAVFGAYRWLDPMRALARLPVSVDGMVVSGTKVVMRQPRLTGYTKDERPYTLTARSAAKDLTNPDAIEMEDIRTTIQMPDRRDVVVTAREGVYEAKAEAIRLTNGVVVKSPEYEVLLKDALVNVRAGTVVSDKPVEVKMLQGTIRASRIEVAESGAVIRFEGGVTVDIDGDVAPTITGAVQ
jgi:lipopolysaccharide export system protein LptC